MRKKYLAISLPFIFFRLEKFGRNLQLVFRTNERRDLLVEVSVWSIVLLSGNLSGKGDTLCTMHKHKHCFYGLGTVLVIAQPEKCHRERPITQSCDLIRGKHCDWPIGVRSIIIVDQQNHWFLNISHVIFLYLAHGPQS